jgi:hypothetical protein
MRVGLASETPATMPNSGVSRCQPSAEPARYSVIRTWRSSSAGTFSQAATFSRSGKSEAGIGGPGCSLFLLKS